MEIAIREMNIADYDQVIALWNTTEGIGLSSADEKDAIHSFLRRNPGLSFVAVQERKLIAAVLCGHDGRRGFIHHLAVEKSHRRCGLGQQLVNKCLDSLRAIGIQKSHIFVFKENQNAIQFWDAGDWIERVELTIMSKETPS